MSQTAAQVALVVAVVFLYAVAWHLRPGLPDRRPGRLRAWLEDQHSDYQARAIADRARRDRNFSGPTA